MKRLLFICAFVFLASVAQAQTPVALAPVPKPVFTQNGAPLVGGCLSTFSAGTTTPLASYTDSTGSVANANPIILDANGSPTNAIYLSAAAYKFQLKTAGGSNCSSGSTVWTADNVSAAAFLNLPNTWTALQTFSAGIAVTGTGAFTNAGVFTNTQMNNYLYSLLGGCSLATEIEGNANATQAVAGCVPIPVGATINNAAGVAGFVNTSCNSLSRTVCNGVGGYFQGRTLQSNAAVWGGNFLVNDVIAGTNTGHHMQGVEVDVNVFGTPAFVRGVSILMGGSGTIPANNGAGIEIFAGSGGGTAKWSPAIVIDRAATSNLGIVLDGQLGTNPTNSQQISFSGYDGGGTGRQSSIRGTSNGDLQLQPNTGAGYFVINNAGGFQIPGSTSGQAIIAAPAVAGTPTFTLLTVSGTVPARTANIDLATQAASIGSTLAYSVTAAGQYVVTIYGIVSQAATTSSTLPTACVLWTDADSNGAAQQIFSVTASGLTNTSNTTSTFESGTITVNPKISTTINYAFGNACTGGSAYASVGGTPMQFAAHVRVAAI